ncbi:MAG: hypothetical protein SangKO_031890 [Sandaracinaceae bacterium]
MTTAPPIGQPTSGRQLEPDDTMGVGSRYRVYLAGYDSRGLWRAWNELQRHFRFVELDDAAQVAGVVGALAAGALTGPIGAALLLAGNDGTDPVDRVYNRPPRLLGRNASGAVYDATAVGTTWRTAGNEYTWGGLFAALSSAYDKDGTQGTLGAYCAAVHLAPASAAAVGASEVVGDVARGAAGVVQGGASVVEGAGSAAAGIGEAASSAGRGVAQLGAASQSSPLLTLATVAGLGVSAFLLARELK